MPTKTLVGTISSIWEIANFVEGLLPAVALPIDGDTVIIPTTATLNLAGATLNRSADVGGVGNGLNLLLFQTLRGCTISIGTASVPAKFTADKILIEGSGTIFLSSSSTASGDLCDRIIVNSPNTLNALDLQGLVVVTTVELTAGAIKQYASASGVVLQGIIAPKGTSACKWTVPIGFWGPDNLIMHGGEFSCYGGGVTLYISGGSYTTDYVAGLSGPTTIQSGGRVNWNAGGPAAGPGRDIILLGGTFDMSGHPGSSIGSMRRARSATFIRRADGFGIETTDTFIGEA